jgi:hypothetical protein
MELAGNLRKAKTRPLTWVAATLFVFLALLVLRTVMADATAHVVPIVQKPVVVAGNGLLDRGAERIPTSAATGGGLLDRGAERIPTS